MTGEPTVLGMINSKLNDISCDLKDIKGDLKDGAVRMENHNTRLCFIEEDVKDLKTGQKKIKEAVYKHSDDKKLHYNQGYEETFPQKLKRKSPELTVSGIVITIVSLILNYYFG